MSDVLTGNILEVWKVLSYNESVLATPQRSPIGRLLTRSTDAHRGVFQASLLFGGDSPHDRSKHLDWSNGSDRQHDEGNQVAEFILAIICFCVVCVVAVSYATQKQGFFIDELYSFGLSNSHYAPFVDNLVEGGLSGEVLTREDLMHYLTVQDNQRFDYESVWYNQSKDVHPPLFYLLLHTVSSFFPDIFSKWIGLAMQFVLWLAVVYELYRLSEFLFHSKTVSSICVLMYGLSSAGLSTFLMIRMYLLLTLFTLILTTLVVKQFDSWSDKRCVLVGLAIFFGLMTQYLFVFYAFFLCAIFVVRLLFNRRVKDTLLFSLCAFTGVALFFIVWPHIVDHLFMDGTVSGTSVVTNVARAQSYINSIKAIGKQVLYGVVGELVVGAVALVVLLVNQLRAIRNPRDEESRDYFSHVRPEDKLVCIGIASLTSALIITVGAPYKEMRYVFQFIPLISLPIGYAIFLIQKHALNTKTSRAVFVLCTLLSMLIGLQVREPSFLYKEASQYNEVLSGYRSSSCVFFHPYCRRASVSRNLQQLALFDTVVYVDDVESRDLDSYLEQHGNSGPVILFFDDWGAEGQTREEEVVASMCDLSGASTSSVLYTYGTTTVYLLEHG